VCDEDAAHEQLDELTGDCIEARCVEDLDRADVMNSLRA
jgi:hypothetical protein